MQFDVTYQLTKDEIYDGLRRAELRRASMGRLLLQTVVLAFAATWCLVAFFGGGMNEWMSLIIGGVAILLIPVMWLIPTYQMKHLAEQSAEEEHVLHLWVFDDGVDFGEQKPESAYYTFGSFRIYFPNEQSACDTLVLRFKSDEVVVIPHRVLTDEQWQFFSRQASA